MKLTALLSGIEYRCSFDINNIDIKRLICNSQEARTGDLFIAIKGEKFNGHDFLNYLTSKGVSAAVVEDPTLTKEHFVQIKVADTRIALSILARNFYNDPSKKLGLIGITGTNGKTTISYILESIFKSAGLKTGVIGTINYRIGENSIAAKNTTPDLLLLNSLLKRMAEEAVKYCIMEVSSHGLDQGRVENVKFKSAVFTNLTHEHLDYHKTLQKYLDTKLKLFEGLDKNAYAVLNSDSRYFDEIISRIDAEPVTYGIDKSSDVSVKDLKMNLRGATFTITSPAGNINIKTSLIGRHNIYNILAASAVAIKEGVAIDIVKKGIESLESIPGRMEPVKCTQGFKVFVDYAHTEDALRNSLSALRKLSKKKKIIVVFGCGGDRDKAKRPKMGKVAAELANFSIITSDNPRSEDPEKIAKDIEKGFEGSSSKYTIILDRFEAIKKALAAAVGEDVIVLIAGKGHETNQIFKNEILPFDDRQIAGNILE